MQGWDGGGVEHVLADARDVRGEPGDAVGVYAAEVGGDEVVCDCGGVVRGGAGGAEEVGGEEEGFAVGDGDVFGW